MTNAKDRKTDADATTTGKAPEESNDVNPASQSDRDDKQPVSDGDAIAELGDEVGGPA
jgi:hypothetical protein